MLFDDAIGRYGAPTACHVCGRGFPDDLSYATHLLAHPGRTDEETALARLVISQNPVPAPSLDPAALPTIEQDVVDPPVDGAFVDPLSIDVPPLDDPLGENFT